jgi:hypothetical protein
VIRVEHPQAKRTKRDPRLSWFVWIGDASADLLSTPEYRRANLEMADQVEKHYKDENREVTGKERPAKREPTSLSASLR